MHKVGWLTAVPGTLGLMAGTVYAAASEEKPSAGMGVDELSLYTTPKQKLRYVEPEAGQLEQGVTVVRKTAEPYVTWCQGAFGTLKPKVDHTVQFGKDSFEYLKNPPSEFFPRAGIIGFAGALGLFLARGSRLKRLIYPTGLMALGASLYYPQQAAEIAKSAGDGVYDWTLQAYVAVEKLWKDKPSQKQAGGTSEKSTSGESKA
ncbi:apolipoprotein O, a isoform X2 [Denticeps clupeoides]|uniref:apolipoprotein O, a isoform X2 n=1 Tax=Denticeps clupeoides TaxID=299321 RepID=UPI0010A39D3D|nr:MICOS complex subunit MIC26-like isoform X2 [Denticeps clupeoides]